MEEVKGMAKLWLTDPRNRVVIGEGRAQLLKSISERGSIAAAARSIHMSYRTAWHLVDSMNSAFSRPLVETSTGGRGGGKARLTPLGELVLQQFFRLQKDVESYLSTKAREFKASVDSQEKLSRGIENV